MPFTIARTLDAPIDRVFDWLADATNYLAALPITRVDLTGPGSTEPSGVAPAERSAPPASNSTRW